VHRDSKENTVRAEREHSESRESAQITSANNPSHGYRAAVIARLCGHGHVVNRGTVYGGEHPTTDGRR
jgi:hypothetical protein